MSVIRIEETVQDHSVEIKMDGVLDRESIAVLDKVCHRYLNGTKRVVLNLQGLTYITREGRNYLTGINDIVTFVNIPQFMRLSEENRQCAEAGGKAATDGKAS